MKKISTAFFVFILLLIIIFWSLLNRRLISKSFESFSPEISDSIETLVIGDSHTQTALNPALMRGCISMSYSDENYFFTYYKLKWALEKEKNIKNVILDLYKNQNYSMIMIS